MTVVILVGYLQSMIISGDCDIVLNIGDCGIEGVLATIED